MNPIKRLLIALLLVPLGAFAQAVPPPCFPAVNGYHPLGVRAVPGNRGVHVFWFCTARKDQPVREYGFSVPLETALQWHRLTPPMYDLAQSTAKVSTAQRLYRDSFGYRCVDVRRENTARGRMCAERQAVFNANYPNWLKEVGQ